MFDFYDPYDTYDYILEFCKKHKISHLFFFLLGDYGKNDKNISYDSSALHKLINHLFSDSNIGIHPSYNSFLNPDQIKKEVLRLKNILGSSIDKSRFHFLRFKYPDSCKNLISNEIYNDYSMGYSDLAGFRAGTCTPFYFYDLEKCISNDKLFKRIDKEEYIYLTLRMSMLELNLF